MFGSGRATGSALFIFAIFVNCHGFSADFRHNRAELYFSGSYALSRLMKSNYSNAAQLKDLMTAPPMSAAQHAEVMRKRIAQRRMVEEARELKRASSSYYDKR